MPGFDGFRVGLCRPLLTQMSEFAGIPSKRPLQSCPTGEQVPGCGRLLKVGLHLPRMQPFHYHIARLATGSSVMLDEIRTFVVLAESGSLQRAAERLFLTPSAVTRQIQRLEAALNTPLLDRRVKA